MITVGIDLSAEPQNTAVASLRWAGGRARLEHIGLSQHDDQLVVANPAEHDIVKIGIDCPLGWPIAFREFVNAQADGLPLRPRQTIRSRESLAYRETDLRVAKWYKPLRPLSVSADRIGHVAFRCAPLLQQLDPTLDRTGHGLVVETYPAGSLFRWGLPYRSYKGRSETAAQRREQIVEGLDELVQFGFNRTKCLNNDHLLDAVIAAVTARCAQVGQATLPDLHDMQTARAEGWIAMPTGTLADLAELVGRYDR